MQICQFLLNSRVLKFLFFFLWWVGGVYGSLHMVSLITCSWKEGSLYLGHCIQTTCLSRLCRNSSLYFDHCIKITVSKTHFQRDLVGKTSVYVWVTVSKLHGPQGLVENFGDCSWKNMFILVVTVSTRSRRLGRKFLIL